MGRDEAGDSNKGDLDCLTVLYTNCRSAKGKTYELSALTTDYDIVCLTETHINESIPDRTILDRDDFIFYRKDRSICGGGVLIAISQNLQPKEIVVPNNEDELIFVRILSHITIGCYYRPNQGNTVATFKTAVEFISTRYPHDHLVIIGDMNFPGFNWTTNSIKANCQYKALHRDFQSFLIENSLTQVIEQPTHVKGNTLDLLCTNDPLNLCAKVISPGISDHFLISVEICYPKPSFDEQGHARTMKLYQKVDVKRFQDCLRPTQLGLKDMSDINDMWNTFSTSLRSAVKQAVPVRQIRARYSREPIWFNKSAKKLVRKHRKTYSKYKETLNPFYLEKYNTERRSHKYQLLEIKQSYLQNKICKPLKSGNSKPFYRHLRWAQGSTKPALKLTTSPDGTSTDNPSECATVLNNFFQEQFCPDHQLVSYDSYPKADQSPDSSTIKFTTEGIENLIHSLKNGKAPGPDSISKHDLSIDSTMSAKCLAEIFNTSFTQAKLPDDWKIANVTPLHKKGASDRPGNYRPISLTSIPCKMMEHIVLHHLNETLDKVLHSRQHGFRRGLSCETQLCSTHHDIARSVDVGNTVHAVVLDFAKAFDKVPHQLLMTKLSQVPNIDMNIVRWVHDFLDGRRQRVVVYGHMSQELPVTSGVPQGSVLGPTLFLVYINDLPQHVNCNVSLFADDTLIYQTVNTDADKQAFQSNIDGLENWAKTWCMSFNVTKCAVMSFNSKNTSPSHEYRLGDSLLEIVSDSKYLGVTIQSDLKFNNHIVSKIAKAKQQLAITKRVLYNAPKDAKLLAYTSLCRPHVEYASAVWDTTLGYLDHDIEMVQHNAVRFICNLKGRDSVSEAVESLGLETLGKRREKGRHSLLHRILSNEQSHNALVTSYEELMNARSAMAPSTRSAARGDPPTIFAKTSAYYNSFLPKTVRELKYKLSHKE